MSILVFQVSVPSLAYICLGGFVVIFSIISIIIKEWLFINEVILGTGFGVLIGPYGVNIFDPRAWGGSQENRITLEFMRIVLVIGLFSVGVELPRAYMKDHAKGLLVLVVPTMAFGWVVVSAVLHGLFPGLDEVSALCIAACLTPTDPITCAAIIRGNFARTYVPEPVRWILDAEAASNDGMAYPFLSIAIYLTVETSIRVAIGKWFLIGWLYQVILGTVLGAVLGLLASKLMKFLALAIFTAGVASFIGADDLLAAFAAGCAISWDGNFKNKTENDSFSSIIDYVLNCGCFIYIGAWLPFGSYSSPELGLTPWRLVVLMLAILVLRRIPFILFLYSWIPEITSWKEALLAGHFGPMGVSAVFVSAYALTRLPVPENPPANQAQLLAATIQPIVSFVVLGSIIVHGLSIPLFVLGREVRAYYTRNLENNTGVPTAPGTNPDVERGIKNGKDDSVTEGESEQSGSSLPCRAGIVIPASPVQEVKVVTTISNHNFANGGSDVATKLTQIAKENPDNTEAEKTTLRARFPSAE